MAESKAMQALFPGPRRAILGALFADPDRWWSLPDLAGRTGLRAGSLRGHMAQLRQGGLVRARYEGRRHWFQPDPACTVHQELQAMVAKLTAAADASETVLVVEDQPATAKITRILLESWGYRVLEAHGGAEAIALFEQHGGVQLLLTDVNMPGLTGPELADILLGRDPLLRVVFMSGYARQEIVDRRRAFLPKPFTPASLARTVRRELDRPRRAAHMNG